MPDIDILLDVVKRLEEIAKEITQNIQDAEDSCIAEGYPSNGSNFELRVELWNAPLLKEEEELLEDYGDYLKIVNGKYVINKGKRC